jgi:opacity protein-like surface antigen
MPTPTQLILKKDAGISTDILSISKTLILMCVVCFLHPLLHAQAIPTASEAGDLQIGGTFALANSDYAPDYFKGFGFYSTFDFRHHLGVEAEFHQLNDLSGSQNIYERTYEVGPRYVVHYRRFQPYVKVMYGRGVFNYPAVFVGPDGDVGANLAYNLIAAGTGVDYHLNRSINLRVNYEYQRWLSFPTNGLTPEVFEFGLAYHFH